MLRQEIINKEYNCNHINYLWVTKQISKQEYHYLKNKDY
jgi:hypothetical protein